MEDLSDSLEELPKADLEYRRLRLYAIDMDTVRSSLIVLRRYRRDDVRFALIRDIAVTYSRPFVATRTPQGSTFTLGKRYVPTVHRDLHAELLRVRNTLFAHSDLRTHRPQLLRTLQTPRRVVGMSFSNADYRGLLNQIASIRSLAEGVNAALQLTRLEPLLR
jgi:hypothetical protein